MDLLLDAKSRSSGGGARRGKRFHSFVMDESHLLSTVRYVERNPIVTNLCDHPKEWKWSSARAHFMGQDDKLERVKTMLARIDNWGAYLSDTDNGCNIDMIKQHTRIGRPLGSVGFMQKLESMTGMDLSVKSPGRKSYNLK
jgi:putative transposase